MMVVAARQDVTADYLVAPRIHLGGAVEIDVGALEYPGTQNVPNWLPDTNGGAATATWTAVEPTLRVETDLPDVDEYEVRIYDAARDRRLVAAVELVSPSNKDRPETRRAFLRSVRPSSSKMFRLRSSMSLPSATSTFYAELLVDIGRFDSSVATPPSNIYAVACRGTNPAKAMAI